ncbi:MAG: hypothetical protein QOH25_1890 [Acidobacteriota bacterium]|nr:hypothetical protein [Acidobacteriota bacterium]
MKFMCVNLSRLGLPIAKLEKLRMLKMYALNLGTVMKALWTDAAIANLKLFMIMWHKPHRNMLAGLLTI